MKAFSNLSENSKEELISPKKKAKVLWNLKKASSKLEMLISEIENLSQDSAEEAQMEQSELEELMESELGGVLDYISYATKAVQFQKMQQSLLHFLPKYWKIEMNFPSLTQKADKIRELLWVEKRKEQALLKEKMGSNKKIHGLISET